jgi:hypothetical protein
MAFPEGQAQPEGVKLANNGDDSPKLTGKKGSAFVYTSRVEHRGLRNQSSINRKVLFVVFEPFHYICKNMQKRQATSFIVHGGLSHYNTFLLGFDADADQREVNEQYVKNMTQQKRDELSSKIPFNHDSGIWNEYVDIDGFLLLHGPYQFWK